MGRNFLAPPYYSQRAVFESLRVLFSLCTELNNFWQAAAHENAHSHSLRVLSHLHVVVSTVVKIHLYWSYRKDIMGLFCDTHGVDMRDCVASSERTLTELS